MKEAGELLAVEAIDRTGMVVTSEGALVRIINVTPPNPLILSAEERVRIAQGYCHLLSRLRADQSLQFYVVSRPIDLDEILAGARREVSYTAGDPPRHSTVRMSTRWRCRAGGCTRRWRSRCASTPTSRRRCRPLSLWCALISRCAGSAMP